MHLLVPTDFSTNSLKALEQAQSLARPEVDQITVVYVVEVQYDFASQVALSLEQHLSTAMKRGNELLQNYRTDAIPMNFVVLEGNPAFQIAQLAAKEKIDLIVMGTQGASGIKKTFIGTVTVSVIRESSCPVLVVPASTSMASLKEFTVALEFADHEPPLLDWLVAQVNKWKGSLQIVHVQQSKTDLFKAELLNLGIERYLDLKFPNQKIELIQLIGSRPAEILNTFMESKPGVLVMCPAPQGFWEVLLERSESIQMAFHTHVPLLILH